MFKKINAQIVFVALAALVLCYPDFIYAQDRAGTLQGVVKDASGAPVAGAFVKMKNAERRLTFMVVSQAAGRYSVNTLPSGRYVVQGVGGEFQSEMSPPVDVAAGRPATHDISLTAKRAPQLPPHGRVGGPASAAPKQSAQRECNPSCRKARARKSPRQNVSPAMTPRA